MFIGLLLVWLASPWALVALAWRKWARSKSELIEDAIDDPAFFIGQILTSISCCALVPLYLPATARWEQLRIEALEYGLIITAVSVLAALFILKFGINRARWLSFAGCLLNLGTVVMFALSLAE